MSLKKFIFPYILFYQKRGEIYNGILFDLKYKYGGTILGSIWFILNPILTLSVYAILYAVVFKVRPVGLGTDGYIILVFTGLSTVLTFTESLNISLSTLSSNKGLILNNIFPPELIVSKSIIAGQLSTSLAFLTTCLISLVVGKLHLTTLFLIPIVWISLIMFSLGISWVLSLIGIVLKDLQHLIGVIAMILTITSPYAYTPEMVPRILRIAMWFNPLTPFVLTLQSIIAKNSSPNLFIVLYCLLIGIITFSSGYMIFRNIKPTFFDYV